MIPYRANTEGSAVAATRNPPLHLVNLTAAMIAADLLSQPMNEDRQLVVLRPVEFLARAAMLAACPPPDNDIDAVEREELGCAHCGTGIYAAQANAEAGLDTTLQTSSAMRLVLANLAAGRPTLAGQRGSSAEGGSLGTMRALLHRGWIGLNEHSQWVITDEGRSALSAQAEQH